MSATIVDWGTLGKVVLYALAGGIGLTLAFSLALHGAVRSGDRRRHGGAAGRAAYGVLAAVGGAVCVAGVVLGLQVMLDK